MVFLCFRLFVLSAVAPKQHRHLQPPQPAPMAKRNAEDLRGQPLLRKADGRFAPCQAVGMLDAAVRNPKTSVVVYPVWQFRGWLLDDREHHEDQSAFLGARLLKF